MEVSDPLYKYGYGIVAFRDILWSMFWIFAFFSVLASYQMQIYRTGTMYQGENTG
jgi:hypothetical protein